MTTIVPRAQKFSAPLVNIGDPAPLLKVQNWIKGTQVNNFERGKIYVVEFWTTWCGPCIAEMPRLSAIARKYKDSVTVLGIDIYEKKTTTLSRIKAFVDSMDYRMDYSIAVAYSDYIENEWLKATREIIMGIPRVFIVDRDGKLAWMGHPCDNFEDNLSKIVNNKWNINESLGKRNLEFRLRHLDDSLTDELEFAPDGNFRRDSWKRDSAALLIDGMAKTEPLIKFTPRIAHHLFSILLKTDMKKAHEYGKKVITTATYEKPATYIIRGAIEDLSKEINIDSEIYELGIDAIQADINDVLSCYPEIRSTYKSYYKMAEWYWLLCNKPKAIDTQEKAIEALKKEKNYSKTTLIEFEKKLWGYKKG
jgi:thiol-disulfide isomerase/thioredoxin